MKKYRLEIDLPSGIMPGELDSDRARRLWSMLESAEGKGEMFVPFLKSNLEFVQEDVETLIKLGLLESTKSGVVVRRFPKSFDMYLKTSINVHCSKP